MALLCGPATSTQPLIVAHSFQGVGGALLAPGSLALVQTSFAPADRARAVGAWSGLSGIAAAAGPVVGGGSWRRGSWRLIFLVNLPLAALVVYVAVRHVPEGRGEEGAQGLLVVEARAAYPLVPPRLSASRQFVGGTLVTVADYGAAGGMFFMLFLQLQQVLGYSPVAAGMASLPITGLMLVSGAVAAAGGRSATGCRPAHGRLPPHSSIAGTPARSMHRHLPPARTPTRWPRRHAAGADRHLPIDAVWASVTPAPPAPATGSAARPARRSRDRGR